MSKDFFDGCVIVGIIVLETNVRKSRNGKKDQESIGMAVAFNRFFEKICLPSLKLT